MIPEKILPMVLSFPSRQARRPESKTHEWVNETCIDPRPEVRQNILFVRKGTDEIELYPLGLTILS